MHASEQFLQQITRRHFFGQSGLGLGTAALASMMGKGRIITNPHGIGPQGSGLQGGGLPGVPHFAPKAKRAIWLFMAGAPSQIDMFDYKPKLNDLYDTDLPESIR
ncbi:MAG: hypothetical protein ACJAYX_005026, partial [Planctomycetota bacterium]